MKRQPLLSNPMGGGEPASQPDNPDGFSKFAQNTDFLRSVLNPNLPEPGAGVHVPVWLSPKLAKSILAAHGRSGHAIPHPNINIKRLDR